MKSVLIAAALVACASQVTALSCLQPDVARTFKFASEAEESYSVLMGTFRWNQNEAPQRNEAGMPEGGEFAAQFTGQILGQSGFMQVQPVDVTVQLLCSGPWCGSMPSQRAVSMAFVEVTDTGYVLRVNACGGNIFSPLSISDVDRVEACMRGQACEESRISR